MLLPLFLVGVSPTHRDAAFQKPQRLQATRSRIEDNAQESGLSPTAAWGKDEYNALLKKRYEDLRRSLSSSSPASSSSTVDMSSTDDTQDIEIRYIISSTQWILAIVGVVLLGVAVYLAVRCNPHRPWTAGILAGLFPEVYLAQHTVRLVYHRGYSDKFCGCMSKAGCLPENGRTAIPAADLMAPGHDFTLMPPLKPLDPTPLSHFLPAAAMTQ